VKDAGGARRQTETIHIKELCMRNEDNNASVIPASNDESEFPLLRNQADAQMREAQENIGASGISITDLPRIKVPAGGSLNWIAQTLEGEESRKEVECIILIWKPARQYWKKGFSEGGGRKPPDCHSPNLLLGRGDPGGNCHSCCHSQFGSSASGRGTACKEVRELLLGLRDEVLPYLFTLPPSSVKPFSRFLLRLYSQQIPFSSVVVRLGLELSHNADGIAFAIVQFAIIRRLTAQERQAVVAIQQRMKPLFIESCDYAAEEELSATAEQPPADRGNPDTVPF
jgi:hypothetical protein